MCSGPSIEVVLPSLTTTRHSASLDIAVMVQVWPDGLLTNATLLQSLTQVSCVPARPDDLDNHTFWLMEQAHSKVGEPLVLNLRDGAPVSITRAQVRTLLDAR